MVHMLKTSTKLVLNTAPLITMHTQERTSVFNIVITGDSMQTTQHGSVCNTALQIPTIMPIILQELVLSDALIIHLLPITQIQPAPVVFVSHLVIV